MARLPDKIGKYKVLSLVGKGGMGLIYAAQHPTLKRKIILKKLTIKDKEFRERFRLEADLMMDLRSDYIVDMYDHFREGSSYYIAMEFIDGITLEELISRKGALEYDLFLYIMSCTAKAIEYIHERGIIHRDIKPSNIYISRTGDVKLGDFGIASLITRDVKITDSGSAMGTPAYMAPEQFNDSSSVDRRADIFSFGVTLYEAICGEKPFNSGNYTDLKQEISKGKYKRLSLRKDKIPFYLWWMISRALMVNPAMRQKNVKSINHRFTSEFKKIGLIKIREKLSALVESDGKKKKLLLTKVVNEKCKKKAGPWLKIMVFLFLIILFSFFVYKGAFYRIFLSGSYGEISLTMIPASSDGYFYLFRENSKELSPVKEGAFNKNGTSFLRIKEGSYRVRIESGSKVDWKTFYVPSYDDSHGAPRDITVLSEPLEQFPLELSYTVKDRFSGEDIASLCTLSIASSDGWHVVNDTMAEGLLSGSHIDLKFDSPGYESVLYSLEVAHYQTSVRLDVLLSPFPALLKIGSFDGTITLNGDNRYFSLETLQFEKMNNVKDDQLLLKLLPGKYTVAAENNSGRSEQILILKSGDEQNLSIENNEENILKIELE